MDLERRAMHQARIARVRMPGRRTDFTPPPEPSASRERIPARETGPPSIHRVQIRVYTSHATGQRRAQAGRQGAGDREGDGQTPRPGGHATGQPGYRGRKPILHPRRATPLARHGAGDTGGDRPWPGRLRARQRAGRTDARQWVDSVLNHSEFLPRVAWTPLGLFPKTPIKPSEINAPT